MTEPDVRSASFDLLLPADIFSQDAIKRAAYALMARADISFEVLDAGVRCNIRPVSANEDRDALVCDFRREVLDQDLRISIEAQTEPMRNAILGLTFSRTGLQE